MLAKKKEDMPQMYRISLAQLIDAHILNSDICPICDLQGMAGICERCREFQEGQHWTCLGSLGVCKDDLIIRLHYLLASPYINSDEVAGYYPGEWVGWHFTID
jgi:hypothetical protein